MDRNKGEVCRSSDNGNTWGLRNLDTLTKYLGTQGWYGNIIWVDTANSNKIVVGGIDLYKSFNGGGFFTKISRWQDYHNGGSANSAHADQHFIVEATGYDEITNPKVYFSNDGGIQKTNNVWSVSENSG